MVSINKAEQVARGVVNGTLKTVANVAKEKVLPSAEQKITQIASSEASMAAKSKVEGALNAVEKLAGKLPDNITKIPGKVGKIPDKVAKDPVAKLVADLKRSRMERFFLDMWMRECATKFIEAMLRFPGGHI